jgi:hypothetical protein
MDTFFARILAFEIRSLCFGFTVFEEPSELLEWGVRSFRHGKNAVRVPLREKATRLIVDFRPHVIVVNMPLIKAQAASAVVIKELAQSHRVRLRILSRNKIVGTFSGRSRNKHEIALAIAERYPELASRLPPKRKPWQSEDYRMKMFDAAALGLTYLATSANSRTWESFRRPLIDV